MNYFQLVITDEPRWQLKVEGEIAPLNIWACRRVETPKPMRYSILPDGPRVDYGHTGWANIPIISRRMGECLALIAHNDIQLIPAVVDGIDNGDWKVLNVLARPDCLDREKSTISYYPPQHPDKAGKPRGVMKLFIDPNRVEGHHVFRVREWEVALIVSEVVVERLTSVMTTGVEYSPVT